MQDNSNSIRPHHQPLDEIFLTIVDRLDAVEKTNEGYALLKEVVAGYGLRHAAYLGMNIKGLTRTEPYLAVTYTNDWVMHYRSQNYVDVDPVLSDSMKSILPMDWKPLRAKSSRVRRMFGEAVEHGVGTQGLSFPIRGRNGETAIFSITSDYSDATWADFKRRYMRDFQTLAVHVHQMILRAEGVVHEDASLSRREAECLQLAAHGKTFGEIAMILSLGERTVKFYVDIARHKLNSTNVTHAVAKALSMNLIGPPN
jgi:DNA-binding CsgD family transcriptional regulator